MGGVKVVRYGSGHGKVNPAECAGVRGKASARVRVTVSGGVKTKKQKLCEAHSGTHTKRSNERFLRKQDAHRFAEQEQAYTARTKAQRAGGTRTGETGPMESRASERARSPAASPCGPCCRHRSGDERGWPGRRRADRRTPRLETRSRRLPPAPTTSFPGAHLGRKSRHSPSSRTLIGLRCPGRGREGGGGRVERKQWFQQKFSRGARCRLRMREVVALEGRHRQRKPYETAHTAASLCKQS